MSEIMLPSGTPEDDNIDLQDDTIFLPFGTPEEEEIDVQDDNIYSYEGWRAYVNRPAPWRPPPLPLDSYRRLPKGGRRIYDDARKTYIMKFRPLNTPMLDVAKRCIKDQLAANLLAPIDEVKTGVILDGYANLGKTTMVKVIARQFERRIVAETAFRDEQAQHDFIPVVHVTLLHDTTPKAMALDICNYLHIPLRGRETESQLVQAIYDAVKRHTIRLIVVDDIHFLKVRSRDGVETSNFMKSLMSKTGATFVYVGIDVESMGILQESGAATLASSQTASRFIHVPIPAFSKGKPAWTKLLNAVETHLLLLDHEPGTLAQHADLLYDRTGGSVGPLMNLLRKCALQALGGKEHITLDDLRGSIMDYRSMMEGSAWDDSTDNGDEF